jgi:hypothetical protein
MHRRSGDDQAQPIPGIDEAVEDLRSRHRGKREARTTRQNWSLGSACAAIFSDHSLPEGPSRLLGVRNWLPVIRPAKVVPVSMAGDESAEPLLEGSVMSREHPASGQEQQERRGERRPSEGGAGWVRGESKAAGA